jgi:RNA polymerase sigma-70 factor (ECF subfamily)
LQRRPDQTEQVGETLAAPAVDANRADADEDAQARTLEALRGLPARFRKILVLREVEGLAMREVARRLGLSRGAAERRWARAVVVMSERLGELGRST